MLNFQKIEIKQNIVSTIIFLTKIRRPLLRSAHLLESRVVYIFICIAKSVFFLVSQYILVYINH